MLRMNFDPSGFNVVKDVASSNFNIYPNPTTGILNLDLNVLHTYEITINNALGQTIYSRKINDISNVIDLSLYDKGIYTIQLTSGDIVCSKKFLLE